MPDAENKFTILVIDDEISILNSLQRYLGRQGYDVLLSENGQTGISLLEQERVDLILLDLKMPGMDGFEVLEKVKHSRPDLPIIIQTAHGGVPEAVKAVQKGAIDFLVKGDSPEILKNRVAQVYEHWVLRQENNKLREINEKNFEFEGLIGESFVMQNLKKMIVRVALTNSTVLIQGESGTGKELIARALHCQSDRRDKPFIPVDCASISESIFESEFFGHRKGSFTGANKEFQGMIRSADTGTLFLDEIGEMPLSVQAKLLRTLQERQIRPVGSTKFHDIDVRIIAATNRNLLNEVNAKTFRQDLYYRLNTITLTAPPLKKRDGDIELLTEYILEQYSADLGRPITITENALQKLVNHTWPGNVRELDNTLKGAAILCESGVIDETSLQLNPDCEDNPEGSSDNVSDNVKSLIDMEREAIERAIELAHHDRTKTVKILGISEATLYRKIKKYNLKVRLVKN
ncbi:sigma-54-dependent transcriptional regulator [Desulforhopalus singaporensis]|uniref:Two-component system, NtrC family, response regulator n=1 Tax=Desulforhopalus singaporensis TaxID=91360 RepID=A0A1H0VPT3_9BACT|nr:sigma-54 dependent transcriptional regulator [Desulforhopalus singaporensis]SDP80373.1 two-component system, NtrC family, response regulator [Desulforhopalus singaporensis]